MKWYLMVFTFRGQYYCILTTSCDILTDIANVVSEKFRVEQEPPPDERCIKYLVIKARAQARALHLPHIHDLDDPWTFPEETLPAADVE